MQVYGSIAKAAFVVAFLAFAPIVRAQDTVSISNPAEFNAYSAAVSQNDPRAKAAGLESFLTAYPQSVVKKVALDMLLDTYSSMGDADHALGAASRQLKTDPNNFKAMYASVIINNIRCEKTRDARFCNEAAAFAQKGLAATKSADVSDANWEQVTAAAYPVFRSAIAKVGATEQARATGNEPPPASQASQPAQGAEPQNSPQQSNASSPLAILGIPIWTGLEPAINDLTAKGFQKVDCSDPQQQADCFVRGADEAVTLRSDITGNNVNAVVYQFSGSMYSSVWNQLKQNYGAPMAAFGQKGWFADCWQDAPSGNAEILTIGQQAGSTDAPSERHGVVTLRDRARLWSTVSLKPTSSPFQYSSPVTGTLHQRAVGSQTNEAGARQNQVGSTESPVSHPEQTGNTKRCDYSPNSPIPAGDHSVCVEGSPVFRLSYAYCYAPIACAGLLYDIGTAYLTGGSPPPQLCAGCSATPRPVHKDEHQAFLWIRWAAELDYNIAQFQVAKMYVSGTGVSNDESQGENWFRKAAEKTTLEERFWNGESCYFGRNMPRTDRVFGTPQCSEQDFKSSFMWFTLAAEQGHAKAMWYLGAMYEVGRGVAQDYTHALEWYTKSAQAGSPEGQVRLGVLYYEGRGVTQDYTKAFEWWGKAADQNHPQAQHRLGVMYEHGEGVTKDYKKAIELYTKAAQQRNPEAELALGQMYEFGRGVQQDYSKAADWYKEASKDGSAEGAEKAKALKPKADAIEQAYAIGYLGESPDGGEGVELIASITGSIPVRVIDQTGNVAPRELVSFRLDYRDGHSDWLEMVCLHKTIRAQNSPVDDANMQDACDRFTAGKRYRLVGSPSGHWINFYPSSAKFPVSEFQIWKHCINTRAECPAVNRSPIAAIRKPDGVLER